MTRRNFFQVAAIGGLRLSEYEPKSTLRVAERLIRRARFPVADVHTHLFGLGRNTTRNDLQKIALWMDDANIRTMLNLTGGDSATILIIRGAMSPFGSHFFTAAEPSWKRANEPDFAKWQAEELAREHQEGARGLKILKTLGLYLRGTDGKLVAVDDTRFDPMWEAAGALQLPVLIHTADPAAFFEPIDRFNERYEELQNHPDWSFYGKDFPSKRALLEARNRVVARHPKTTFIGLHVANCPEDLTLVGEWLDRYPNLNVEIGARLGELGRQPRTARRFFERYQDRILFGTDGTPDAGKEFPQQDLRPEMYYAYFRFLETEDEYFDYAPAAIPPQGRWRIYGIGLPQPILAKFYHQNADRIFRFA